MLLLLVDEIYQIHYYTSAIETKDTKARLQQSMPYNGAHFGLQLPILAIFDCGIVPRASSINVDIIDHDKVNLDGETELKDLLQLDLRTIT